MNEIDHKRILHALDLARQKLVAELGDPDEADLRIRSLVNLAVTTGRPSWEAELLSPHSDQLQDSCR